MFKSIVDRGLLQNMGLPFTSILETDPMTDTTGNSIQTQALISRKGLRDPMGNVFTPYQLKVRENLIAITMDLFHGKGYDATTISDIMDKAGKTPRTFFRYFRGKDVVAFDWLDEQVEFIRAYLKSRPKTETPMQSIRLAFLELAAHHDLDEQDRVKFLTRLILETPALSASYHHEYTALDIEHTRILARLRAIPKTQIFALNTQISVVTAAFNLGLRAWVADGNHCQLRPWIETAFAAFADGRLQAAPSNKSPNGRKKAA